jgi:enamine deaminase RidA (YjgF/YER057c/UK114 family)
MTSAQGPVPQGNYVVARRHGDLIFTSGMTPRRNGVLCFAGAIPAADAPEDHREAVELAFGNALTAARSQLAKGERLRAVINMVVFIAAELDFTAHSRLADFASHLIEVELGAGAIGTRSAVGVATLPGNATVEIQLVATV